MSKKFITRPAVAVVLVAALFISSAAKAINMGEVVSQSKLGEPLLTKIELAGFGNEVVEDACLSLVAPAPDEGDARDFLVSANLAVKKEGNRQFAVISTRIPYNEPFVKFKLQVKCVGIGNTVKSYTILPDFPDVLPITAPAVAEEAISAPASNTSVAVRSGREPGSTDRAADQDAQAEHRKARSRRSKNRRSTHAMRDVSSEAGQTTQKNLSTSTRTASTNRGKPESVRLRLAGGSIDESRIGKISQEERGLLLARQKLLDADDQMASFLAMQDQVKQLQAELGMLKLKVGQLGISSSAVTPTVPTAQIAAAQAPDTQAPDTKAPDTQGTDTQGTDTQGTDTQDAVSKPKAKIQRGPIIIGLLALLGLLLGVRHILNKRALSVREEKPVMKPKAGESAALKPASFSQAPAPVSSPGRRPGTAQPGTAQPRIALPGAALPGAKPAGSKASSYPEKSQAVAPSAVQNTNDRVASSADQKAKEDSDSIIEEAELYAIHGHPDRAIVIIKELLHDSPANKDAWMLLFSIYSSTKAVAEFEQATNDFLRKNKKSDAWPEIQALGRSIDPANTLYADTSISAAVSAPPLPDTSVKRALIGDILLTMGVLSEKTLKKCLAEFNPKVDGRLGGYLVNCKVITEAQLDAALQQQKLENEQNTQLAEDKKLETNNELPEVLKFEPPSMDLPKMTKSLEIDRAPGNKPDGE